MKEEDIRALNPIVVVSHGSGVNGLSIVRSIGRHGINVYVIAKRGSNNLAAKSRYCTAVLWINDELPGPIKEALSNILTTSQKKLVLFCDSDESLYLTASCLEWAKKHFLIPYQLERLEELQNKEYQASKASAADIAIPKSWYPNDWEEIFHIKTAVGRRLLVKPNPSVFVASAPFKVFWAVDAQEVSRHLNEYCLSPKGMIVQEYIEGSDENMWVVSGYRSPNPGKNMTILTMIKTKQSGSGAGGVGIIVQTRDCKELNELASRFLNLIEYFGPFAMEFKYCEIEKQFYFIENNFRTARIHVIGRRVGADLPAIIYADITNSSDIVMRIKHLPVVMWYYDFAGCFKTLPKIRNLTEACRMIRHMLMAPFRKTEWAVHSWDDCVPVVTSTWLLLKEYSGMAYRLFKKKVKFC